MKLTQQQKILSVLQSLQSGDHHIPEEYVRHHRRATASVLIVGGGVAGTNAARIAFGMGADLTVLDRNLEALRDHARPTLRWHGYGGRRPPLDLGGRPGRA